MKSILLLACLVLITTVVSAQTKTWTNVSGNWSDANLWSPAGVPAAGDDVTINGGITIDIQAVAKSIVTGANSSIDITSGSQLEINGSTNAAISMGSNTGITILGSLKIGNITPVGSGIVATAGASITIGNGGFGSSAQLSIDGVQAGGAINLGTHGTLTNNGSVLSIGQISSVNGGGIRGTNINNNVFASINISKITGGEAIRLNNDTLNNSISFITISGVSGASAIRSENGAVIQNDNLPISIDNITNTTEPAIRLIRTLFINNTGTIQIGAQGPIAGDGISIEDETTFTNNGFTSIHNSGTAIEVNNLSHFINAGEINLGENGANQRGISLAGSSTFLNNTDAAVKIINTNGDAIDVVGNSSFENKGRIGDIQTLSGKFLYLEASSFLNYGTVVGDPSRGFPTGGTTYMIGGAQFVNYSNATFLTGPRNQSPTIPANLWISGPETKFLNQGRLEIGKFGYGNLEETELLVENGGKMVNDTNSTMMVGFTTYNALVIRNSSELQNHGYLEFVLNPTESQIVLVDTSRIINSGTIKYGTFYGPSSGGGILMAKQCSFENSVTGKIFLRDVTQTPTVPLGGVSITNSQFNNYGNIIFDFLSNTDPTGVPALYIDETGLFTNQSSGTVDFDSYLGDGIAYKASASIPAGFVNQGTVKFGNVKDQGLTNLGDPTYPFSNYGRFETKPNGNLSMYATVINENGSELLNAQGGTVTTNFPFTNKDTITNNGTWNANAGVTNSGLYKGTGLFKNTVFSNSTDGTIAPGNSTGCTNFDNGVTNAPNSSFSMEINGKTTACDDFDQVNVTGNLNLAGAALKVTFGPGYTPVSHDSITIIKSTSLNGTFASNDLPSGWEILYNTPSTGDVTLKLATQLKTWNNPSGDWSNGALWLPVGVPNPYDSVLVIGNVDITTQAVAKNIAMAANSSVNIRGGGKLAINHAECPALRMGDNAQMSVRGDLLIGNTALVDSGIVAGPGANLDIQPNGTLSIDRVKLDAAIILGTNGILTNNGSLKIGEHSDVPAGIKGAGIFNTGSITIKNIRQGNALTLLNQGLQNFGSINISSITAGQAINADHATITNNGTITIDSVYDSPSFGAVQLSGGTQLTNDNIIRIGSLASVGGGGIITDNAVLTNNGQGVIFVSKADYGIMLYVGGHLINSGTIGLGTDGAINGCGVLVQSIFENKAGARLDISRAELGGLYLEFSGSIDNHGSVSISDAVTAVQIEPGSTVTNQTDGTVDLIHCRLNGIVSNVSAAGNPTGGFVNHGVIQFGDIGITGWYNVADPLYPILNFGILETKTNGKMALNVSLINENGSQLNNVKGGGTVTIQYPFINKGTINNSGTMLLHDTMINENEGTINNLNSGTVSNDASVTNKGTINNNNGTWNANNPFSNNGLYTGNGVFRNRAFNNNANGIVSPGNSPGCMRFENGFINEGGSLLIEVNNKNTPCVDFDRVNVTGSMSIEGGLLNINFGAGYTPVTNDMITILKSDLLSGTFTGNVPPGWTILYNEPGTGDITLKKIDALPLTLLSFDVKADGSTAKTTWKTSDEINTSHFDLERSNDGISFSKLATITAMNTGGDHSYGFTDVQPFNGRNYYRLRMVDIDASYTYSKIVTVDMSKAASSPITAVYPNPAKDVVNIAVTTNDRLIVDLVAPDGRRILTKSIGTPGVHTINVAGLAPGLYFLKVSNGEVYKLIKE